VALEAEGEADRAQANGQHQAYGAGDGQGDPGGGLPRPARRGGGDDKEQAGGEEMGRGRGWDPRTSISGNQVLVFRLLCKPIMLDHWGILHA